MSDFPDLQALPFLLTITDSLNRDLYLLNALMDLSERSLLRRMITVQLHPVLLCILLNHNRHKLYQILYLEQVSWLMALRFAHIFLNMNFSLVNFIASGVPYSSLEKRILPQFRYN